MARCTAAQPPGRGSPACGLQRRPLHESVVTCAARRSGCGRCRLVDRPASRLRPASADGEALALVAARRLGQGGAGLLDLALRGQRLPQLEPCVALTPDEVRWLGALR